MKNKKFVDVKVDCFDNVTRDIRFVEGRMPKDDTEVITFCQRNCELSEICKLAKSPDKNAEPGDTFEIWCASQEVDGSFYPTNGIRELPDLFEGFLKEDPAFRLSEIKKIVCSQVCLDYVEGEDCGKCQADNPMCIIGKLLLPKKTRELEEENEESEVTTTAE